MGQQALGWLLVVLIWLVVMVAVGVLCIAVLFGPVVAGIILLVKSRRKQNKKKYIIISSICFSVSFLVLVGMILLSVLK